MDYKEAKKQRTLEAQKNLDKLLDSFDVSLKEGKKEHKFFVSYETQANYLRKKLLKKGFGYTKHYGKGVIVITVEL